MQTHFPDPQPVADTILSILRDKQPKLRYIVANKDLEEKTVRWAVKELVDLTEDIREDYPEEKLVEILGETITK